MINHFVSVYVPSTKNVSEKLTRAESTRAIDNTARLLSLAFGGCTATRGTGYYVSNDGRLIRENVTIVKSYTDKDPAESLRIAEDIARGLKVELTQESVTVESNDGLEFV